MKILTKLMLASAVMVTSGFAGGVSEFQDGGTLEAETKLEFESNGVLTMNADKSLHVHGSVVGTGQINCQGTGQVIVYQGAYAEDSTNAEAIKTAASSSATTVHTYDPNIGGHIDSTVTVDPASSLVYVGPNLRDYASGLDNTNLVYVANADGGAVRCAGGTDAASEIVCELANTDASIDTLKPASLVVENKVKFSGKNTGFTSGKVTYGTLENPTETEIASQDAFFPVESVVEQGSKLSLTAAEGTTISKNLTVNGCNKWRLNDAEDEVLINDTVGVLSVTGPVTVTNGACLKIKGKTEEAICEYPKNYPLVKSWPKGSFSGELLNPKYKRYYEFENMSVEGLFNVSGCVSVNEMTGEVKVESGMKAPETVSDSTWGNMQYLNFIPSVVNNGLFLQYTYMAMSGSRDQNYYAEIATANLPQYESTSKEPELVGGNDGVFSLALQETDSMSRAVPNMFFQPNSLNLDNLDGNILYLFDGDGILTSGSCLVFSREGNAVAQISLAVVANDIIVIGSSDTIDSVFLDWEGAFEKGYFLNVRLGELKTLIPEIDAWTRTHTFEETWLTLDQYNTKHNKHYTFGG